MSSTRYYERSIEIGGEFLESAVYAIHAGDPQQGFPANVPLCVLPHPEVFPKTRDHVQQGVGIGLGQCVQI
jgi:hypothetical protein